MASGSRSGGTSGGRAFNRNEREKEAFRKAGSKQKADYSLSPEAIRQLLEAVEGAETLGVGMGGKTRVFNTNFEGEPAAVKIMTPETNDQKYMTNDVWKAEIKYLAMLNDKRHAHILQLIKNGTDGRRMIIIYELMESTVGQKIGDLKWDQMLKIMTQTADAIQFLHQQVPAICHNDIKPANLLIKGGIVKVGDFGNATPPGKEPPLESKEYLPPSGERKADTKRDVYSFGVTALQIVNNIESVDNLKNFEWKKQKGNIAEIARMTSKTDYLVDKNIIAECTESTAAELTALLKRCCDLKPNRRPNMDEVLRILKSF